MTKEKKKNNYFKKKAYVFAILGDSSLDEESDEDEVANIFLVAYDESENKEVNKSKPSYDELLSEYNALHFEFER